MEKGGEKVMSYSKLTNKYLPVASHSGKRTQQIRHIVIHHNAGINSIESLHKFFLSGSRQVSANYGIGNDGRIACYVDEENRAWTTGGDDPDQHSITIEVSNSSTGGQWPVSEKAINSVIKLCADIIKRYKIKGEIFTGEKDGILQMHKWYQATACPGPYLESKFKYIAEEVKKINSKKEKEEMYKVQVGAFEVRKNAEKLLKELNSKGYEAFIVEDKASGANQNTKSISQLADEVIAGLHGNGEARKKSLGSLYDAVQAEVNRRLS